MQNEDSHIALEVARRPRDAFCEAILAGLRREPKHLPCKYLYDEVGSHLFDKICSLPEYYLTRVELAIMRDRAAAIADLLGPAVLLVEYGSGSSTKTRLLLEHLADPAGYVPVDISREHLEASAARLARVYRHMEITPVCADFTASFRLPTPSRPASRVVVYFPGSTVGNFHPQEAVDLLRQIGTVCGVGGGLLIGVDLKKDPAAIDAAYNDAQGVTAAFNLNMLHRINRELRAAFRPTRFRHRAVYDARHGRVELGLVSRCRQSVHIGREVFRFARGEEIRTEYSYKYTVRQFEQLAARAGFTVRSRWSDRSRRFAVFYCERLA